MVFCGLCQKLHTTSDPEASGGKIKVPKIGVQQIHTIPCMPLRKGGLLLNYNSYFRHYLWKSKRENELFLNFDRLATFLGADALERLRLNRGQQVPQIGPELLYGRLAGRRAAEVSQST